MPITFEELFGEGGPGAEDGAESFFEELVGAEPATESIRDFLPPFLRWSPGYRGHFPPRPTNAPGGRAFMGTIAGKTSPTGRAWIDRENAIVQQLVSGNMPDALVRWVAIDLSVTRGGRTRRGKVEVTPDYLCVGSDTDFVHVPLDPVSAQKVADELDATLPTARVCHAIYQQASAGNRIGMISRDYYLPDSSRRTAPRGQTQDSSAAYLEHSEAIQSRMRTAGIRLGSLVAGHKKDVVIARALHGKPNRIAFHGFYDARGFPMEPCYENPSRRPQPTCPRDTPTLAHSRRFSDYSQGVRLMSKHMVVDGAQKAVAEVLADPELSWLLSSEGPIAPPRIPDAPAQGR